MTVQPRDSQEFRIQLAAFLDRSTANGPGSRAVVWVQGCSRRCPGCFNPGMLDFDGGTTVTVAALADRILAIEDIAGVTFSGGEPLAQAESLAFLARRLQEKGLSVVLFTGYTGEELSAMQMEGQRQLLDAVDLVVAGPYREDRPSTRYLCGSENQELLFLTERLRDHPDILGGHEPIGEFFIGPNGEIRRTGLLPR